MSSLYQWEGEYRLLSGDAVLLCVGYSWGDPNTGIGAGVETVAAYDDEGNTEKLSNADIEAIYADAVLAERIEDEARDKYVDYMENRQ